MEWLIAAALAVGVLGLAAAFVLRTKRHDAGCVPGRFNFDGDKEGEMSQRGHVSRCSKHDRLKGLS